LAQRKTTPKKPVRKRRTEYDQSYKRLFSHPKMVEDLLKGFVHEDWVKELDFTTLEVFKDSFVSDNLLERHDDIIWRVRWGKKKWLYVYLLLLQEMKTMLHETMQNWYRDAEIKGEARGITIGEERGITIGEERGEARGETKILTHLLETKFGILPPSERATIERLNSDAMLKCSERLLTAKTLQEVIKPA